MKYDPIILKLLKSAPVAWQGIIDREIKKAAPHSYDLVAVSRAMEDDAGRLAFLAEYLAARADSGRDHPDAVKRGNARKRKVDRALGYSYPERRQFHI